MTNRVLPLCIPPHTHAWREYVQQAATSSTSTFSRPAGASPTSPPSYFGELLARTRRDLILINNCEGYPLIKPSNHLQLNPTWANPVSALPEFQSQCL